MKSPLYRSPRTTAEIRANEDPDHKAFVRGSRRQIPTAWDDVQPDVQRSWKKSRKTRWK